MGTGTTQVFNKISDATDFIFQKLGNDIRMATPLGLGKPNLLLNEIYERVKATPHVNLKIYTALSLDYPHEKEDLAQRFFKPFIKRQWGDNYPHLAYYQEAAHDKVPFNVQVHEFYFQAGTALSSKHLQRHYQSVNYTHVTENILRAGVNVLVQLIAVKKEGSKVRYSLSCNPDLSLDVYDIMKDNNRKFYIVGVIHPDLPFLADDAEVPPEFFDVVVDSPEVNYQLFSLPRTPMSLEDHLIGFYSSLYVKDEGTIQIGIGSLSDAVVSALHVRQRDNANYIQIKNSLKPTSESHSERFQAGLYGVTEMLTDGFMHLRKAGILKRTVSDESTGKKTYLHGSFILGSKPLYEWLRTLSKEDAAGLRMTRVSSVNDLYDPNETLLRKQRIHPRFFNTTMQVTLMGEAMSETLPNGNVISGVGGQYNFVSMAKELKDSRSLLMLRSTRLEKDGNVTSNIVWTPGHVTVPRHLRDLVVTEYGAADLLGKTDEECIQAMLAITDSRFQEDLMKQAKAAGKLAEDYIIPKIHQRNMPKELYALYQNDFFKKVFVPFPFGSDFTPEEEKLAVALGALQKDQKVSQIKILKKAFATRVEKNFPAELDRMGLKNPKGLKEKLYRKVLLAYLQDI
jgi:acyl-CoA hydrolase